MSSRSPPTRGSILPAANQRPRFSESTSHSHTLSTGASSRRSKRRTSAIGHHLCERVEDRGPALAGPVFIRGPLRVHFVCQRQRRTRAFRGNVDRNAGPVPLLSRIGAEQEDEAVGPIDHLILEVVVRIARG